MDAIESSKDSPDSQGNGESQSESTGKSVEGGGPASAETPTEDIKTAIESRSSEDTECHSTDKYQTFHIKPPSQANKQSSNGYFISKVTPEHKSTPPPSRSIGKVFVIPKRPVSGPVNEHYRSSLHNQPSSSVQAAQTHANIGQMPMVPQTVNRFIIKPIPVSSGKHTAEESKYCQSSSKPSKRHGNGTKELKTCFAIDSSKISLSNAHIQPFPINSSNPVEPVYLADSSVTSTHQIRCKSTKDGQQCYRDIRQSLSSSVNTQAVKGLDESTTWRIALPKQNYGTETADDKLASKTYTSTTPAENDSILKSSSTDETDTEQGVSDKPAKQSDCEKRTVENSVDLLTNNDQKQTQTPVKKKRNRKPKVYFSPSGNHISEPFDNRLAPKGSRKRKLAENTLDKQYFGALKRTFAKRTKPLSPNTGLDMKDKDSPNNIEISTSRISPSKCQDSDYKLKQKAVLAASTSSSLSMEKLRGNPLLEKLDLNDTERKESLAIFNKQYQIQNSNPTQAYKLSIASSLGHTQIKEVKEQPKTNNEENAASKKGFQTFLLDKKEQTNVSLDGIKVLNDLSVENSVGDEKNPLNNSVDAKICYESDEYKSAYSAPDLGSVKSITPTLPSVVLQRMKGIKPTETVQVSQILKQSTFNTPSENKESKQYGGVKQDMPLRNIDQSKPVECEWDKCTSGESKTNTDAKATAYMSTRDNAIQANKKNRTETSRDEGLLHKLLFSDEQQPVRSEENVKPSDSKCHGSQPDLHQSSSKCRTESHNSDNSSSTSTMRLPSVSNMNISQTIYLAQPIPVFYSTKERLIPGPMPIISDAYQFKLSRDSTANTRAPITINTQSVVSQANLGKDVDNGAGSSSKSAQVQMGTNFPVKDPTGILTPVSKTNKKSAEKVRPDSNKRKETGESREGNSSRNKTVAELLKEKRIDQCKEKTLVGQPKLEFASPASALLGRDNNNPGTNEGRAETNESSKEENQTIKVVDEEKGETSATKLCNESSASVTTLPASPGKPVSDHLYSSPSWNGNKLTPHKPPFRSASYSPLAAIAGMEHRYSRSVSPKGPTRTLSSETTRPTSLIGNSAGKCPSTSPLVPLKIVLPSPKSSLSLTKSQSANMSSSSTINVPVTVQTLPGMSTQSKDNCFVQQNVKTTVKPNVDTTHHSGIQGQTNQSFAVRIGDKMYIIKPALPVQSPQINSPKTTVQLDHSSASSKPEIQTTTPKAVKTKPSRKRKSAASNPDKQPKSSQTPTHQKVMKKKIKKLLKKDKTQFEELIQSLGLEHNKDKRKKPKRKPSHKITYSCTPSPAHSHHNTSESAFPIKEEFVTPEATPGPDTPILEASTSKIRTKATKVVDKKAIILQIFKSSTEGSKFYMHTAKLRFTSGRDGDYRRWYNHSDYPCKLHLRHSDIIHQIDVETLRSGFYLVSEMDKNILKSKSTESHSVSAVLSLYPPDMNILPEGSMAIAVGKINDIDESEQPIPNENETDTVNKNVENIIKSILELDDLNAIEQIEDERYGSVKDVSMSPKCHSSKFYTPDMFECFTQKRRTDMRGSCGVKISNIDSNLKSVSAKRSFEDIEESDVTVSTKAHELKMKQNELYQECSKLREKIQTDSGLLQDTGFACSLDTLDELPTGSSRDDDMPTDPQDDPTFNGVETMNNDAVNQLKELNGAESEIKAICSPDKDQEDQTGTSEFDKNVNCCVQRKTRGRGAGWSRRPRAAKKSEVDIKRCTRSNTDKQ